MNCNDLMLGDLVQGHLPNTPSKVVGIPNEYRIAVITPGGAYMELSIDDFLPIPLTPEILKKSGFSQDPLNGHIFIFHEKSGEVIYYECGPKYGLTIDNQLATIQDLKINYVHELQHALRLCGIEKDITL